MFNLNDLTKSYELREDIETSKIWAVGSINGDLKKLEDVIVEIETNAFASNDKIVFLGNYLGKGKHNKDILDLLSSYQDKRSEQVIILRGSEEQKMINSSKSFFESDIGKATIKSYRKPMIKPFIANITEFNSLGFSAARKWLNKLPTFCVTNYYYLVHSGVCAKQSLLDQSPVAVMFIRDPRFFKGKTNYEKIVVHTHEETKVAKKKNRIAVSSGKLVSVVVLDDTDRTIEMDVLQV